MESVRKTFLRHALESEIKRQQIIENERLENEARIHSHFIELCSLLDGPDLIELVSDHDTPDSPVKSATLCEAMGVTSIATVRSRLPTECACGAIITKTQGSCVECKRKSKAEYDRKSSERREEYERKQRQDFIDSSCFMGSIRSLFVTEKHRCKCGGEAVLEIKTQHKEAGETEIRLEFEYLCPKHAGQFILVKEIDIDDLNHYGVVVDPDDARAWKRLARETISI